MQKSVSATKLIYNYQLVRNEHHLCQLMEIYLQEVR